MGGLSNDFKKKIDETIYSRALCLEPDEVNEKSKFESDLGLDSLDKVELVMEVERKFDISIDDVAVEEIVTVQDLYDQVEKRI